MNTINLKLTQQEQNIINYLSNKKVVAWEELVQFSKDPTSVKLKTIKRVVSEIKRKYTEAKMPTPFNCEFTSLNAPVREVPVTVAPEATPLFQTLVQVKKTPAGTTVLANSSGPAAHVDFVLDKYNERVITKYGPIQLSEGVYKIFAYLHANAGKFVTQEDLRDVLFDPKSPSKIPHTWAKRITGYLTDLRKCLPDLKRKDRLITVPGVMTSTRYMLV